MPPINLKEERETLEAGKKTCTVNTEKASAAYYHDVLKIVLKQLRWHNVGGPPTLDCNIVWSEDPTRRPNLLALPRLSRTNRFFAMVRVCRKVPPDHTFS